MSLPSQQLQAENGKPSILTYGGADESDSINANASTNGLQVKYIYDLLDRISKIQYNIGENGAPMGLKYRTPSYEGVCIVGSAFFSTIWEVLS